MHCVKRIHKNYTYKYINQKHLLESVLEFLGNSSVVVWFFHDLTDHFLLAVKVIVVEVLVHVLEKADPLDDVKSRHIISLVIGPIMSVKNILLAFKYLGKLDKFYVHSN